MFLFRKPHPWFAKICRVRLDKYLLLKEITFSVCQLVRNPSAGYRALLVLCSLLIGVPCVSGGEPEPGALPNVTLAPSGNFFSDWFTRVDQAQADQPHWVTPIVTVTPRLEEELRYDQFWERNPGAGQSPGSLNSYGGAKV